MSAAAPLTKSSNKNNCSSKVSMHQLRRYTLTAGICGDPQGLVLRRAQSVSAALSAYLGAPASRLTWITGGHRGHGSRLAQALVTRDNHPGRGASPASPAQRRLSYPDQRLYTLPARAKSKVVGHIVCFFFSMTDQELQSVAPLRWGCQDNDTHTRSLALTHMHTHRTSMERVLILLVTEGAKARQGRVRRRRRGGSAVVPVGLQRL